MKAKMKEGDREFANALVYITQRPPVGLENVKEYLEQADIFISANYRKNKSA